VNVLPGVMTPVVLPAYYSPGRLAVGRSTGNGDGGIFTTLVDTRGDDMLRRTSDDEGSEESDSGGADAEGKGRGRGRVRHRRICDAIVLAYDVNRKETFERCAEHWLPLIARCCGPEVPVILAGNKIDLQDSALSLSPFSSLHAPDAIRHSPSSAHPAAPASQFETSHRSRILALMARHRSIQATLTCSAATLLGIHEVFFMAQNVVLFPIAPLYNLEECRLRPECVRALCRVFRIFDVDHDGLIDDRELNDFHVGCFGSMLPTEDISGLKKILSKSHDDHPSSFPFSPHEDGPRVSSDNKITLPGFLSLIRLFVEKYQMETPWTILRMFGYDDSLHLAVDCEEEERDIEGVMGDERAIETEAEAREIMEHKLAAISCENDGAEISWILSDEALNFLVATFGQFDVENNGVLRKEDLESIFFILDGPSIPLWHPLRASRSFHGCFSSPYVEPSSSGDMVNSELSATSTSGNVVSSSIIDASATVTVEGGGGERVVDKPSPDASIETLEGPSVSASPPHHSVETDPLLYSGASSTDAMVDVSNTCSGGEDSHLLEWIGKWHMISALNPIETRVELYRLGYINNGERGRTKKAAEKPSIFNDDMRANTQRLRNSFYLDQQLSRKGLTIGRKAIRIRVFGSGGSGKTAFMNYLLIGEKQQGGVLSSLPEPHSPKTRCTTVFLDRGRYGDRHLKEKMKDGENIHLIITEVPEKDACFNEQALQDYDVSLLIFDINKGDSLLFVRDIEDKMDEEVPRIYICTNYENECHEDGQIHSSPIVEESSVLRDIRCHCKDLDLEPPLLLDSASLRSAIKGTPSSASVLEHIAKCALGDLRGRPHAEKKRKEAKRRQVLWLGLGIVSIGVVVIGTGMSLRRRGKLQLEWLRSWWKYGGSSPRRDIRLGGAAMLKNSKLI